MKKKDAQHWPAGHTGIEAWVVLQGYLEEPEVVCLTWLQDCNIVNPFAVG